MKPRDRVLLVLLSSHFAVWVGGAAIWLAVDGLPPGSAVLVVAHGVFVALLWIGAARWARRPAQGSAALGDGTCGELELAEPGAEQGTRRGSRLEPDRRALESEWRALDSRLDEWLARDARRWRELARVACALRTQANPGLDASGTPGLELRLEDTAAEPAGIVDRGLCTTGRALSERCCQPLEHGASGSPQRAPSMTTSLVVQAQALELDDNSKTTEQRVVTFGSRGRMSSRARVLLKKLGNRVRDSAAVRGMALTLRRKDDSAR